jgi:fatty acid-binding protein DegV
VQREDDHPRVLADWLAAQLGGGPAWIGVTHGNAPDDAERLATALRERFDGDLVLVRPTSPTVYLHAGPKAIGAAVFPLRDLPWMPPAPPTEARL